MGFRWAYAHRVSLTVPVLGINAIPNGIFILRPSCVWTFYGFRGVYEYGGDRICRVTVLDLLHDKIPSRIGHPPTSYHQVQYARCRSRRGQQIDFLHLAPCGISAEGILRAGKPVNIPLHGEPLPKDQTSGDFAVVTDRAVLFRSKELH